MLSQWHIIGLASFCAIATLLVVGLLMQRARHGRAKAALRDSEERYLLALAGSTDGLWDWDLLSESVFYSDRFREILGRITSYNVCYTKLLRRQVAAESTDRPWAQCGQTQKKFAAQ